MLITLLSSVYSRTQRERVAVFSTSFMNNYLKSVQVSSTSSVSTALPIFQSMLGTISGDDDTIFDYALRIGEEQVYAFNIYSETQSEDVLHEILLSTFEKVKASLKLIEVHGDLSSDFNKKILKQVDACLYCFTTYRRSIDNLTKFMKEFDRQTVFKTGIVCCRYDQRIISERKLASMVGTAERNFLTVLYDPVLNKFSLDGKLNDIGRLIANGYAETIINRPKVLEIMQFLYDNPNHKIIKTPDTWYK